MATAPSRAWKFPTSPRSPYKIKPELKLLVQLQERKWDKNAQLEFARLLAESQDYLGEVSEKETDFAARDRLRGPSTLGFIKKPDEAESRLLLTEVGKLFVNCKFYEETFIFQRQIAKVQFGSPANRKNVEKEMNIRPLGLIIQALKELGQLTKDEMALYCITTTNHREAKRMIELIRKNRQEIERTKDARQRKNLRLQHKIERLENVYAEDINMGNTNLREGGDNFLETKYRTLRDFADSSIRYFLATGLFATNYHRQTFELVKVRSKESDFILEKYGMQIDNNPNSSYSDYITNYLGNPQLVEIWRDSEDNQRKDAARLISYIANHDSQKAFRLKTDYQHAKNKVSRLGILDTLERESMIFHRITESAQIKENLEASYPQIKATYNEISTLRNSMIDKPLMFEWNTWRLFNLFSDSVSIVGNFLSDADGNPLRTAPGGTPDIVCEFKDFCLIVEVTLQSGMKQYETEGEPITRHIGNQIRKNLEAKDSRPVYGLFIAQKVNRELVFYLNAISWRASQYYGGRIQIFPIEISKLIEIIDISDVTRLNSRMIFESFNAIFSEKMRELGELDWENAGIKVLNEHLSSRDKIYD